MTDGPEVPDDDEAVAIQELNAYWAKRLDTFEQIYPTFQARGYGKNTALTVLMLDDVCDAILSATKE